MAALHAERPLLVSFIGAPRRTQLERVALIRGLTKCPNCGVFDVRGTGPLADGVAMAWVYSHSIFCAHPHGDSPTRKGFFDSALYGCIPLVLDARDPANRGRAPFLPAGWAVPWAQCTGLLSRLQWLRRLVQTVQDKYPPRAIRAMQRTLAAVGHLLQYALPATPPGRPPPSGLKPWSARNASAGWIVGGRRCAEDAFDVLVASLAA